MNSEQIINYDYSRSETEVHPSHHYVKSFCFTINEEDEAILCHHLAKVAEKNGMSANDMNHLFPYVLRMLKSQIEWSK